jgi:quercetin dioxygenase-like cupin family protein
MSRPPVTLLQTESIFVRKMYLAPFEQGDLHYHSEVAEHIVCIIGEISISVQNLDTLLLPGESFSISPFLMHQVRNRLGSPSQYLLTQYGGKYDFCASQA